jgi:Flp pilus assembly protein TadB
MEELTRQTSKSRIKRSEEGTSTTSTESFVGPMITKFLIKSNIWDVLLWVNLFISYCGTLLWISGYSLSYFFVPIYLALIYVIIAMRQARKEKERMEISHRLPFFTDALANSLSVGGTLEQALIQSSYYLKGEIKEEFNKLIIQVSLGKDMGMLLRDIDAKFPGTGLRYLISLLEQYRELGVGISPLLKRMSENLSVREEAEEKIRSILAAGSSYARLSIAIFLSLFAGMSFLMRDQVALLLSPGLKPAFLSLLAWAFFGIFAVSRITSMDFTKKFAMRPTIKHYLAERNLDTETLMKYSGIEWSPTMKYLYYFLPSITGFLVAFVVSWYSGDLLKIGFAFFLGTLVSKMCYQSILKGQVEDQLIKTIEIFPDVLQIFIIGLNSGLNTYKAFELADKSVRGVAPKILSQELCRTMFAMQCGEDHFRTWQRFGKMLPFATVIDFCEIMIVAPMHGESIVRSIIQMAKNYEYKKLLMVEKTAVIVGQIVIPLIVISFFPIFLFSVFAPLIQKIMVLFAQ